MYSNISSFCLSKKKQKGPPWPIYSPPTGSSFVELLYYCSFEIRTLLYASRWESLLYFLIAEKYYEVHTSSFSRSV